MTRRPTTPPLGAVRFRRARRGSIYLLVLFSALLVGAIGISAVALSRIEMRNELQNRDSITARSNARAAVEFGMLKVRLMTSWTDMQNGSSNWANSIPLNGGTFSLQRLSYDISDPINDRLTLLATGTCGSAVCQFRVVIIAGARIEDQGWTQAVR